MLKFNPTKWFNGVQVRWLTCGIFLRINLKKFWTMHLSVSAFFGRSVCSCAFFYVEYSVECCTYANKVWFCSAKMCCFHFYLEIRLLSVQLCMNIRKRTVVCSFEEKFLPQKPVQNKVRNHLHTLFIHILTYSADSALVRALVFVFVFVYGTQWSAECSIKYSFDILFVHSTIFKRAEVV